MLLLLLMLFLLGIAVTLAIVMYQAISRLQEENLKLKERVSRLRRTSRRRPAPNDEVYWRRVTPSDLAERINDRDSTILN